MNLQIGGGGGCSAETQFKRSSAGGKAAWLKNREKHLLLVRKGGFSTKERGQGIFSENNPRRTGKTTTEDHKKKIGTANSISQKGDHNSQFGTCWMTKEGMNKKVKKDAVEELLNEGWKTGRTPKPGFSEKMKIASKKSWAMRKDMEVKP
jgi:hypothetical protein